MHCILSSNASEYARHTLDNLFEDNPDLSVINRAFYPGNKSHLNSV